MCSLLACGGEPSAPIRQAAQADSIVLQPLHLASFAITDSSEGGYIIAASRTRVSFTPMRFPGVISVDIASGRVDTVGGISGEGPGELRYPAEIWYASDTLMVLDRARRKLLMYLGTAFIGEEPLHTSPDEMVPDTGGVLVFTARGASYGGITRRGSEEVVALPSHPGPRGAGSIDRIAVLRPGHYAVFDATAGALVLLDERGVRIGAPRALPPWLHAALSEAMKVRSPESGQPGFVVFPEAKFLIPDHAGNVYLFYYLEDPAAGVAVRYSPATDTWVRVASPVDSLHRYIVANAFAGVIVGDTLHLTRDNGTASYRIVP